MIPLRCATKRVKERKRESLSSARHPSAKGEIRHVLSSSSRAGPQRRCSEYYALGMLHEVNLHWMLIAISDIKQANLERPIHGRDRLASFQERADVGKSVALAAVDGSLCIGCDVCGSIGKEQQH